MIGRIQTGKSFKGAALYYLHDKSPEDGPKATTSERVDWTYTLNCLHDDPEKAIEEMLDTCRNQQRLKLAAGKSGRGRPTEKPVMTVALSWHPDMHPDQREMIRAAHDFLKHMKWNEHQVLMVAHNDTKHRHVHLIINKVHPETGMTLNAGWYKKRSQEWALKYEQEQGKIYCQKRVENEQKRQQGKSLRKSLEYAHYGEWLMANQEMNRQGIFDPENPELAIAAEWASLKQEQRDERIAFWNQSKRLYRQVYKEARAAVREDFAERWLEHYKLAEEAKLAIKERQSETRRLSAYYCKQARIRKTPSHFERVRKSLTWGTPGETSPSPIEGVRNAQASQDAFARKTLATIEAARSQIKRASEQEFVRISAYAIYLLKQDRDKEYQALLARQRGDKQELKQDQAKGHRRYDLLAAFGKAAANDDREFGRDREAANSNPLPFEKTAEIIRDINQRELDNIDVSKYVARARQNYHGVQAFNGSWKHPGVHEIDDASRRAIASVKVVRDKRLAEEKKRRILEAQPPVRGAMRKAKLELCRSRISVKESQREGEQEKQTSKDVPLRLQLRRALAEFNRERSDFQQARTAHGGPGEQRDRGGGMER